MHPYKATHFENRKSILHSIALMVLHTDSHHNDHINHHITVYTPERSWAAMSRAYLGTAIEIHDIMLGGKKEFRRSEFGEMCVHLQRAEKLCYFTLFDIPAYLKSPCRLSLDHHVLCLRIYDLYVG